MVMVHQARNAALNAAALEVQYHQGAHPQGHPLSHSLSLGGERIGDGADDILLAVNAGQLVLGTVCGPLWVKNVVGTSTARKQMCDPGDSGVPFHCVVCVGTEDDQLVILDPWYPANSQRFLVDPAAFAAYLSENPIAFTR